MIETFDWLKPSTLWQSDGLDFRQLGFFRPQLFEFRSDSFMEDFLAAVDSAKPDRLREFAVTPSSSQPLKLFQPVHGCFYLASASLCCRQPGFPDRVVQEADGENVFFVLRKLTDQGEAAWVVTESQSGWQPLNGQTKSVPGGEERRPLSTVTDGNGRSLMVGYLPVASRETYNVPAAELAVTGEETDSRIHELEARFVGPLAEGVVDDISAEDEEIALTVSVYLLVDLWDYLSIRLPDVTAALLAIKTKPTPTFNGDKAQAQAGLITFFQSQVLQDEVTLAVALNKVGANYDALNQSGGGDLAELGFDQDYNLSKRQDLQGSTDPSQSDLQALLAKVKQALPDELPAVELPKFDSQSDTQYILRYVYERPQCEPPVHIISQPSDPFAFSPFFDPDAPVRTVRIPLPGDVSIAGIRKFKKGVSFMMSDAMRKKMESIVGNEKSLLGDNPQLNDKLGDGFAFICSFSIEIIFIVAFFLLLMFVIILNFVFWWIAFFKICLPIPKKWLPG